MMKCFVDKTSYTKKPPEDLISLNQLSSVLNIYTKYEELSESFLVKSSIDIAVNDSNAGLSMNGV